MRQQSFKITRFGAGVWHTVPESQFGQGVHNTTFRQGRHAREVLRAAPLAVKP